MPKVSIVIPTYKVEKYIERCVRSLFEQTLDSLEYVFVDDCSPDNSIAVMQKVLEEYPHRKEQVKIIRHEVNQGVGAARNHGIAVCTGDYIIHCDPDDWVDLNMYEAMYNKAIETDADMVYCSSYISNGDKHTAVPLRHFDSTEEFIKLMLYGKINWTLWSQLYRRSIACANETMLCPENIVVAEDLFRTAKMLVHCKIIAAVPIPMYYYRMNLQSVMHNIKPVHLENMIEVTNFTRSLFCNQNIYSQALVFRQMDTACTLLFNKYPDNKLSEYIKPFRLSDYLRNVFYDKRLVVLFIASINLPIGKICCIVFNWLCSIKRRML